MHTRHHSRRQYIDLFAFPLRGSTLMSMLGFALLFLLAGAAGLFGLWLFVLTAIALMQYVFVIIRHSSLGHKEPPPLSIADFNPANSVHPLALALFSTGIALFAIYAGQALGSWAYWVVLSGWILGLPAVLATLTMERSVARAFNPLIMWRVSRGFGTAYLMAVAFMMVALGIHWVSDIVGAPKIIEIAVDVYAVFLMAHSVGNMIYNSREDIGLGVLAAPETREEKEVKQHLEDHRKILDRAYQTARTDRDRAALLLKNYQAEQRLDIDSIQWLFDRLKQWDDHTTALRFAQTLIARRVALGQHHEALKNCLWCLEKNPDFRPHGPRDTYALGRAAMDSGQFRLGITLLRDFAQRFPQDPMAVPALLLAAQHAAEHLNDTQLATALLGQIEALGVGADDSRLAQLREVITGK